MLNVILFIIYVVLMISFGVASSKKTKSSKEFALGNGKAGAVFSAFAYGTTYFSAVMFTLCGSLGISNGISVSLIGVGNAFIGGYLAWRLLAKKTKEISKEQGSVTFTQLISNYFDSKFLKVFLALVVLVFLIPYSASVYQGLSFIFETAFGVKFLYCALILAATTAIYVFLGGYMASIANAFVQGLITVVAVVAFYFVFFSANGVGSISTAIANLKAINPTLVAPLGPKPLFILATVMLTSFGAWGLPQMVQKFFAVDEGAVKKGSIYSTLFCLIIAGGMYFCGGLSQVFFTSKGVSVPEVADKIMPTILLEGTGTILFAIMFVMLIAASMSTLSAITLVSASSFMEDILDGIFKVKFTDKKKLLITRLLCILFVAISVMIALIPNSIINLLSISWGALAGAFLAPYLYMLFGRSKHKIAAVLSSACGIAVIVGGYLIFGKPYSTYIGCSGMIISFIVLLATVAIMNMKKPVEAQITD